MIQVKRLLELLRQDACEQSVVTCDCLLPVDVDKLNVTQDDAGADLAADPASSTDQPSQSSPPCQPHPLNDLNSECQTFCHLAHTPVGRCRTFKGPDVQVRLTSPHRSEPSPASSAVVNVVSPPYVINDPHYTLV